MAEHNKTGIRGEQVARKFLEEKGYKILEINWRIKKLELDLIALHNNTLVFAEVKTRTSDFFGEPEEFVTDKKRKNIIRAANAFIEQRELDYESRFDIISILVVNGRTEVHHIEDAFYPTA